MEKTFERSLDDLEKIVRKLEDGDLALEESLKLFEAGVKLSRECKERLTAAERRIEVLMKDADGNLSLKELQPAETAQPERKASKRIVFSDEADEEPF
jgi:exodeoxyribonuclease VII small subunit